MTKLLIRGGNILDGTPQARMQRADVLIEGERILKIGRSISASGAQVLDAEGLLVTPGFIDSHAHSDDACLVDTSAQGRVFEGVTSEVDGSCGASLFPLIDSRGETLRETLKADGIDADWTDAAGYFAAVEAKGTAINRGFLVGHGAVRSSVMGYAPKPANRRQLAAMRRLVAESLEQGALGLSSGLCYAPGCFARTSEVVELCRELKPTGRPYCTHMRNEGRALMRSIREALAIAERSGAPLHVSHVKTLGRANWWKIKSLEEAIFSARKRGLDVTADRYPYLAAMTGLGSMFPDWLHAGGRDRTMARLQKKSVRNKLRYAMEHSARPSAGWGDIRIAVAGESMKRFEGISIQEAAGALGMDPFDAVCEILLKSQFHVSAVFFHMSEGNLERILRWPFVSVGSDSTSRSLKGPTAKGRPHPRTFGTFGRFLGEYVLQRKIMPLPEAISKITSRTAERFQLRDRGVLRKGAFADVVVFDPKLYHATATYDKPFSLTQGMRHVLVNGMPVLRNGRETGARPGRVLRYA